MIGENHKETVWAQLKKIFLRGRAVQQSSTFLVIGNVQAKTEWPLMGMLERWLWHLPNWNKGPFNSPSSALRSYVLDCQGLSYSMTLRISWLLICMGQSRGKFSVSVMWSVCLSLLKQFLAALKVYGRTQEHLNE